MDAIITVPFGYLLDFLYRITTNYGVAARHPWER